MDNGTFSYLYDWFKKKHPNKINLPFKIIETDRGGDITFHGLGQIIFYTLINLKRRKIFLKTYVRLLENVIISRSLLSQD